MLRKPIIGLMGLSDGDPVVHEKSKDVVQHQLDVIKEALEREDYGEAIRMFESIEDYMDSKTLLKEAKYKQAKKAIAEGDLKTAVNTFTDLGGYKDSRSILKKLTEGALPALGGAVLDMIKKPSEDGSEPGFWDKVLGN